ncbi:MAG: phospho-N-acetylmuramoyl-pentapeptide-transferase [Oscillospiraceae bacterium]|nr:phospho-N-acetylmuramoyl-pentapeptide-transferase [Oscillospiraceae bacterium]
MERTALFATAFVAASLTAVLGFWIIPWLKRLKYGQTINEIGPTWHKHKEGTPAMGGLMFIIGSLAAVAVGYISMVLQMPQFRTEQFAVENARLFFGIAAALGFSAIGFIDDFTKVRQHRNLGLTAKGKILLQIVVAAAYIFAMERYGGCGTAMFVPFIGTVEFGVLYYPLMMFAVIGIVNAVNLTDGLDGLASSVTFVVAIGFIIIASLRGFAGTTLFSTALAASLIGFLCWNFKPARVFMGDTGSMYLGGAVVAMAFGVSMQPLMLLSGIVYVGEAFSVMLQVGYFKLTHGKRIFKMSPIHHHFEMCGWSEEKIIAVFCAVAAAGTGLSVLSAVIG